MEGNTSPTPAAALLLTTIAALTLFRGTQSQFCWTDWMDDEDTHIVDSALGDFEIVDQLRRTHFFCEDVIGIECRLATPPNTPYDQTGQVGLTCAVNPGFMCFHRNQTGSRCFNYEIRVSCPCNSTTTPQPSSRSTEVTVSDSTVTYSTSEAPASTTRPRTSESLTQPNEVSTSPLTRFSNLTAGHSVMETANEDITQPTTPSSTPTRARLLLTPSLLTRLARSEGGTTVMQPTASSSSLPTTSVQSHEHTPTRERIQTTELPTQPMMQPLTEGCQVAYILVGIFAATTILCAGISVYLCSQYAKAHLNLRYCICRHQGKEFGSSVVGHDIEKHETTEPPMEQEA
ncbi:mucin-5B-like [Ptychodera flava]|uniref:mucin-5B-like n=1 Tax=Ptychodera flava TaxID=63121 RepID=UPI00396A3FA5